MGGCAEGLLNGNIVGIDLKGLKEGVDKVGDIAEAAGIDADLVAEVAEEQGATGVVDAINAGNKVNDLVGAAQEGNGDVLQMGSNMMAVGAEQAEG